MRTVRFHVLWVCFSVVALFGTVAYGQGRPSQGDTPATAPGHALANAQPGDTAKFFITSTVGDQRQVMTQWRVVGDVRGGMVTVYQFTMAGEQARQWPPAANAPGVHAAGGPVSLQEPLSFLPQVPGIQPQRTEVVEEELTLAGRTWQATRSTFRLSGQHNAQPVEMDVVLWVSTQAPLGGLLKLEEVRHQPLPEARQMTELVWAMAYEDMAPVRNALESARVGLLSMSPQAEDRQALERRIMNRYGMEQGPDYQTGEQFSFADSDAGQEVGLVMLAALFARSAQMHQALALLDMAVLPRSKVMILLNAAQVMYNEDAPAEGLQLVAQARSIAAQAPTRLYGDAMAHAAGSPFSWSAAEARMRAQRLENDRTAMITTTAQMQAQLGDLEGALNYLKENRDKLIDHMLVTGSGSPLTAPDEQAQEAAYQRHANTLLYHLAVLRIEEGRLEEARMLKARLDDPRYQEMLEFRLESHGTPARVPPPITLAEARAQLAALDRDHARMLTTWRYLDLMERLHDAGDADAVAALAEDLADYLEAMPADVPLSTRASHLYEAARIMAHLQLATLDRIRALAGNPLQQSWYQLGVARGTLETLDLRSDRGPLQ